MGLEGTVDVQQDTVGLGDPITLKIRFSAPPDHRLGPILWSLSADSLAERTKPALKVKNDTLYEITAELALFALGDLAVNPAEVTMFSPDGDSIPVTFPEQIVSVATVITDTADSVQPADFRPIIEPPMDIPLAASLGLIIAILIAAAWLWFRRQPKRIQPEIVIPRRPPWEIATERLDALEASGYHKRGESRLFAIDLSEIVREYLEHRYGFEALEQTTTEIKAALTHVELDDTQRRTLVDTLNGCDLAKYAKFHWPVPELEKSLTLARRFVTDTIPQPKLEEAAA